MNAPTQNARTAHDGEAHIPSPCVRNCCLDDNEVCLGCGRALAEIVGWNEAGAAERRDILARAAQRREAREAKLRALDQAAGARAVS